MEPVPIKFYDDEGRPLSAFLEAGVGQAVPNRRYSEKLGKIAKTLSERAIKIIKELKERDQAPGPDSLATPTATKLPKVVVGVVTPRP